jgi:hypothetical protein
VHLQYMSTRVYFSPWYGFRDGWVRRFIIRYWIGGRGHRCVGISLGGVGRGIEGGGGVGVFLEFWGWVV